VDIKELSEQRKKFDTYTSDLLNNKLRIVTEIEKITVEKIEPLKEEASIVDAEIENIMKTSGIDTLTVEGYGAYFKESTRASVIDTLAFLKFGEKYPSVLKKDIGKSAEIIKLMDEGVMADGVKISSFDKVTFRKLK
tara:strand:+ start:3483 stop:3893 length:411 start_codon:yes stop_codon:yes gene_type:complete